MVEYRIDSALNAQPLIYTQTQFCTRAVAIPPPLYFAQEPSASQLFPPLSVQIGDSEIGIGGSLMTMRRLSPYDKGIRVS